jgi:hypothetical protein
VRSLRDHQQMIGWFAMSFSTRMPVQPRDPFDEYRFKPGDLFLDWAGATSLSRQSHQRFVQFYKIHATKSRARTSNFVGDDYENSQETAAQTIGCGTHRVAIRTERPGGKPGGGRSVESRGSPRLHTGTRLPHRCAITPAIAVGAQRFFLCGQARCGTLPRDA